MTKEFEELYLPLREKITSQESVILMFLPVKWKWIARDSSGELGVYTRKPTKWSNGQWEVPAAQYYSPFPYRNLFKYIKWSDTKPFNIDSLLKAYRTVDYYAEGKKVFSDTPVNRYKPR